MRSETSLIQTVGRAARNVGGTVIMYADTVTPSMRAAITETERRRKKQQAFNEAHGIVPHTVIKDVRDLLRLGESGDDAKQEKSGVRMTEAERKMEIERLEKQMKEAARMLDVSEGTVKSRVNRAKARLKEILTSEGELSSPADVKKGERRSRT